MKISYTMSHYKVESKWLGASLLAWKSLDNIIQF